MPDKLTEKAENERFGKIKTMLDMFWDVLLHIGMAKRKEKPTLEEFVEALQEIKADAKVEAYKEFAERLKNKAFAKHKTIDNEYLFEFDGAFIDNLLKELVGEDK